MDSDSDARMLSTINEAIAWASARESQLMAEVLDLQRRINKIHDTKPVVRKREVKEQVKEVVKQQNVKAEFHKKIDEMISKAEQQIQEIDNPSKNKKSNTISKSSKMVEPLPQIQKKPPIPTINRSKDPQVVTHKPNYHYRNKNEVTGKITETPYSKASQSKIGSSSSVKKQQVKNIFHETVQKQANKKIPDKLVKQQVSSNKNMETVHKERRQVNSADSKIEQNKNKQKILYMDFCSFQQSVGVLIEKAKQKDKKNVGSKRQTIENLISDYNRNQLGYKQNQTKAANAFLMSFNKLSATRSRLPVKKTLSIQERAREAHIQTFNFQKLVDSFQSLLNENPISQQYSASPKQVAKIKHWHKILNEILQQQLIQTRQNLKLPPTLGIQFQMNRNEQDTSLPLENGEHINPHIEQIYQVLAEQLEQLQNLDNFDKNDLRKLRILILIGLYDGKRSPVMIQTDKYQEWKEFYLT